MKIHIGDRTYAAVSPERAELIHLMELKQQTRHVHPGGFGMQAIKDLGRRVEAARKAGQEPDEDEALLFTAMMIYFARRGAGEQITFSEACAFPIGELRIENEPHDIAAAQELEAGSAGTAPDPTPAAGDDSSASGDVVEWRRPARKRAPAKTTTRAAAKSTTRATAKTAQKAVQKPAKRAASR